MENFIENRFDEQFKNLQENSDLHWLPWVGKDYLKVLQGQKLIIIGESHYCPEGERMEDYEEEIWTRKFICKEGLKLSPWYIGNAINPLIANTERAIFKKNPSYDEKQKLWFSVAFFNLIQRLLVSRESTDRPNDGDFIKGWKVFLKLVDILDPDVCLILGKSGHGTLGYYLTNEDTEWEASKTVNKSFSVKEPILISKANKQIKVLFINHPSSFFSWETWAEHLRKHLKNDIPWLNK